MQNGGVGGARILMVEDSDAIRLPVVTALTAQGFHVASVADGSDLEGLLPSFAPDLVILDIMLPGRDGFELLQVIRRTSTAAVLMLTAKDALADRVHGLTDGADDYLIKPFAMAELVARIHAVLRPSRGITGLDRDGTAAAWLPRCAPGSSGEQDPDLDISLGIRRLRRERGRGPHLLAAPQAGGWWALATGAHRTRPGLPARNDSVIESTIGQRRA
jgi:DNA-binding response OmpR family regulator